MIDYQKILNNNLLNVFIDILKNIEKNGLDGSNHLYITFKTGNSLSIIPDWLLMKYPNEMTIVVQHEYYHLSVHKSFFNIGLSFNNKKADLKIAFNSIISFADPSSLNSTKLARDISLPDVSDLTKIFDTPSLFLRSERYCCTIIGYSFPS